MKLVVQIVLASVPVSQKLFCVDFMPTTLCTNVRSSHTVLIKLSQ